jgi:hypothetical protein
VAALVAPGLIFFSTAVMAAMLGTDERDGWTGLIRAALFTGAARLAGVSLFVGLITAWLMDRLTAEGEDAR